MVDLCEAGEKGVLLATKRHKMHKRDKKMTKKCFFGPTILNSSFPHKALHMLDSLYDKRINLALLLAG